MFHPARESFPAEVVGAMDSHRGRIIGGCYGRRWRDCGSGMSASHPTGRSSHCGASVCGWPGGGREFDGQSGGRSGGSASLDDCQVTGTVNNYNT